jgi:hypothetical protein
MNNQIICKVVAVFVMLCSPLPSHAENWVEFYFHTATSQTTGQTMSATESFYDSDSLRMFDNGTFKVWIKSSSSNSGEFASLFGKNTETKNLILINCNNATFEVLSGGADVDKMPTPELRKLAEKANRGSINGPLVFKKLADIFCAKK